MTSEMRLAILRAKLKPLYRRWVEEGRPLREAGKPRGEKAGGRVGKEVIR